MALDDRTAQAHLTPDERRELLRAFADRMLLKITAMDDPEDMPGVERCVRVAAVIERVYSRCDRAERQIRYEAPDPRKLEAERARHADEALKARVKLANTLEWSEKRRRDLGPWWDAAATATQVQAPSPKAQPASAAPAPSKPVPSPQIPAVSYVDYTDAIHQARAALGLKDLSAAEAPKPAQRPPPS